MAKMLRKAQQARSSMQKITATGVSKSGMTAILLNGLNDIEEIEFKPELLTNLTTEVLATEVKEAYKDAKKNLEKSLASTMDIDSIRDMLS